MRVISMHKVDAAMEAGKMPGPEVIQGMGRLMGDMRASGVLVDGAGLLPSRARVRLRFVGGEPTVERGPYGGSNELITAFLQLKVRDMDEAIAWATRYAHAIGDVELEIGRVTEAWDLGVMPKPENAPLRCLLLHKADAASEDGRPFTDPVAAAVARVRAEMQAAGVLTGIEKLQPSRNGQRITVTNRRTTVVDGPFAESKELIAGYVIMEVPSLGATHDWLARFAEILGDVQMDVRVLEEPSDPAVTVYWPS